MNNYRVDRVNQRIVPCGMNSIKYLGDNFKSARKVFADVDPGFDVWGQPNCTYGVILSVWDGKKYVIKCEKGLK